MTDLLASDRTQTRARLADHIKQSAAAAIVDPGKEPTSRMVILGHLLDPAANVVDLAITRFERGARFPTIDRERIADYITRSLERHVLGLSNSPLDLHEIAQDRSPFAWSDKLATACVRAGITEVRRARGREVGADLHALDEFVPMGPIPTLDWGDRFRSAEELFIARERRSLVAGLTEIVETWDERGLSAVEKDIERARAVRTLNALPPAAVSDKSHKRWLSAFLRNEGADRVIRASLIAHRDLAAGEPQWSQLAVDDRLLDLWMDYTADQANALLEAHAEAATLIVKEAAAFPARPSDAKRVAVRRLLKNLIIYRGWPSLVMRLEKAWVAEFFDSNCDGEAITDISSEEERVEAAADWADAATAALQFPGRPLGLQVRTVVDVAEWMMRAYRLTTTRQVPAGREAA